MLSTVPKQEHGSILQSITLSTNCSPEIIDLISESNPGASKSEWSRLKCHKDSVCVLQIITRTGSANEWSLCLFLPQQFWEWLFDLVFVFCFLFLY